MCWVLPYIGEMVDGDSRPDDEIGFEDGTRAVLFAVESSDYPGGVNYRMAYFDSETGEEILRFATPVSPVTTLASTTATRG